MTSIFRSTTSKIFYRRLWRQHEQFWGGNARWKKRNFWSKFSKKCLKTPFLACFFNVCLRRINCFTKKDPYTILRTFCWFISETDTEYDYFNKVYPASKEFTLNGKSYLEAIPLIVFLSAFQVGVTCVIKLKWISACKKFGLGSSDTHRLKSLSSSELIRFLRNKTRI